MKYTYLIVLSFLWLAGCKKAEGPGGNSSIKGKVIIRKFNFNTTTPTFLYSYPDQDDNVFIKYGSQPGTGNNANTDYNGEYYFPYLQAGTYTVYVYSKDSTLNNPSGQLVAKQDITVGSGKDVTAADMTIAK